MTFATSPQVQVYIDTIKSPERERLETIRDEIQKAYPFTIEDISYGMPTYRPAPGKRGIVHFAHSANHIGIYGIIDPIDDQSLQSALAPYRTGKGTLQFKHSEPLPLTLIKATFAHHAALYKK